MVDAGYNPVALGLTSAADLNGDGNQDLVVLGMDYRPGATSFAAQPGRVLLGDGNGQYAVAPSNLFPVDTLKTVHPRKVVFADFNNDGRLDMFVASHGWDFPPYPGEQNRLYLSLAGGGWTNATGNLPQVADFSHSAAAGDLSGRGLTDIIVGNGYGGAAAPYSLLNTGGGQFALTRSNLPVGPGQTMAMQFASTVLSDLNGDQLPELIVTADSGQQLHKTTIFWNHGGVFAESDKTALAHPSVFTNTHIDLDVQAVDVNRDGLQDLVLCGTQQQPFYNGWFLQIFINKGNHVFADETAERVPPGQASGGLEGQVTNAPWPIWIRVLDFDHNGVPDFSVEFMAYPLAATQPLVWMNNGAGRFSTFKTRDFIATGSEWQLGRGQLVATTHGFSFVETQVLPNNGGLMLTGLLAARPIDVSRLPFTNDQLTAGASVVRAIHYTELRQRIDVLRARDGLPQFAWSGTVLAGG